jgi:hypothetical protein
MRYRSVVTILTAGITLAAGALPAAAQTVANGPYYAMPSWDQTLPAATRFVVLSNFDGKAVLDRETGLVWQRAPGTDSYWPADAPYETAVNACLALSIGNRRGWRLPSIQELLSLTAEGANLPAGHPFQGIRPTRGFGYWSSTRMVSDGSRAAYMHPLASPPINPIEGAVLGLAMPYLCVRGAGGTQADPVR